MGLPKWTRAVLNILSRSLKSILECVKTTVTSHEILNRVAPICYIFAISGIVGWGLLRALPFLYSDYPDWLETSMTAIGYFIATQIFVNWLCIVLVDTSYHHSAYGNVYVLPPANIVTGVQGQELGTSNTNVVSTTAGNSKPRKNATAVDIPYHEDVSNQTQPINGSIPLFGHRPRSLATYFYWRHCTICDIPVPPRTHHCSLCQRCILKRDHHCYVAARCIGYRNLRHFSVFVFYASLGTAFAIVHALPYAYYNVIPYVSYADLFYIFAIVRGALGYLDFLNMILIVLGWLSLGYFLFSLFTTIRVYTLITTGQTTFELANELDICDTRDVDGKLKAVFGRYWYLNYLVPLHFIYEPVDDPIRWPTVKFNGQYVSGR